MRNDIIYSLIPNVELRDKQIIKNSIREIRTRLSKIFGDRYKIFQKFLKKNGVFLSGSFIIQCILQVEWEDNYIDIYICCSKTGDFKIFDILENREVLEKELFRHEEFRECLSYWDNVFSYTTKFSYNINNFIVNIIIYGPIWNPRPEFDICQNYYSESKNIPYLPYLDNTLFIKNIDSLFTKKMIHFSSNKSNLTIERYLKYKKKGFKLDNDFKYFLNILDKHKSKSSAPLVIKIENAPYDTRYTSDVFIFDPEEN